MKGQEKGKREKGKREKGCKSRGNLQHFLLSPFSFLLSYGVSL
jgi:hypothetical protein